LLELVRFVRGELGLKRVIVSLPRPLGHALAWLGEYLLPGKPLSLDNLASLGVASVCASDGLEQLRIRARSLAAVAPSYRRGDRRERRLARLRRGAHRGRSGVEPRL
jgi:hypothetical protein